MFITLEGIEGAGKSTQIPFLVDLFRRRGIQCLVTREPGGTPIGEKIRRIVLDSRNKALLPSAELLLYVADRIQHIDQKIRPALEAGQTVVCDRFFDATVVYQGCGRGLDLELIHRLHHVLCGDIKPDLTLLLDLPPRTGLSRAWRRSDGQNNCRFESEALAFHQRVRRGYLELAMSEPRRFSIIDATGLPEKVSEAIGRAVNTFLDGRAIGQRS
jgi:dTMP kinase